MTARPTTAQRRVLALAILALVLALAGVLLVAPVVAQHRHYDERMADLREQLARFTAAAGTRAASEQALARLKRQGQAQRYYLKSPSEALASVELQQHAKRVVERHGGQLVSTQVLQSRRAGPATAAALRVNMRGDIRSLQRVLYELEAGRPLLFLDQISISGYGRHVATAQEAREPELTIRFDMRGYMLDQEAR